MWIPFVIASILSIFFLISAAKLSRRKKFFLPFIFISNALLILGMSFKIWLTYFSGNPFILLGLVASNCLMW
ncbi:MAG: hypothetical protein ABWY25_08090, partial [Paenisporosarcina sp.]